VGTKHASKVVPKLWRPNLRTPNEAVFGGRGEPGWLEQSGLSEEHGRLTLALTSEPWGVARHVTREEARLIPSATQPGAGGKDVGRARVAARLLAVAGITLDLPSSSVLPSPVDADARLRAAATAGDLDGLDAALSDGANLEGESAAGDFGNPMGTETALVLAIKGRHVALTRRLLGAGASTEHPSMGITPLCWAAACGGEAICRVLLEHGAAVNVPDRPRGALQYALKSRDARIVRMLVEAGSVVPAEPSVRNGLASIARKAGDDALVEALLR
jgi:hypothetical protein